MRISDEERSRAVEELRRHCSAGRLAVEDYATRVAEALSAETLADLDHALRDLPRVRIADPRPHPPVFAPEASSGPAGADRSGRRGHGAWRARLVLLVSMAVVVAGVAFVVVAQWVWAVILVLAWLAGLAQGRVPGRRRR